MYFCASPLTAVRRSLLSETTHFIANSELLQSHLAGISDGLVQKLLSVQNVSVSLVTGLKSVTMSLRHLENFTGVVALALNNESVQCHALYRIIPLDYN